MSERTENLMAKMTLREKIGQMCQLTDEGGDYTARIREGTAGSFLNTKDPGRRDALQRIAVEESRLGIPIMFGRDVIHGFRTVFPIPLGQAATWNPELVEEGAAVASAEAASRGVDWTFAPMVDISRDPRWGRIAESCGEDPVLSGRIGAAMVRGFQGPDPSKPGRIAACAKHYVGYGAAEGGRDYNTTSIPEGLLRDVYLPPFRACVETGCATVMSAFNDLNGVPASGNDLTLRRILKGEWGFDGFVVSDWNSVIEMVSHGFASDEEEAARIGVTAGVDMEMVSESYLTYLEGPAERGELDTVLIDDAVRRILTVKERIGLFDRPYTGTPVFPALAASAETAKRSAAGSLVLLTNRDGVLPLQPEFRTVAVIGPLADSPRDQLGCWVFDGDPELSVTPLAALRGRRGGPRILHAPGMNGARDAETSGIAAAVRAAEQSDAAVLFLGEDAGMSGEAHSRAFIDLPGAQPELLRRVRAVGKPVIVVVMAGRPLALTEVVSESDAVLYAWHPGTMGGPAIADALFGDENPSGRLPVTFPRTVGQVPLYYARKNTGRPPAPDAPSIPLGTPLDPAGFTSTYLDADHRPLFPFGYGLGYTSFEYSPVELESGVLERGAALYASVRIRNAGKRRGTETVQLYLRDVAASVTRPVRELKDFTRVTLEPGEERMITFIVREEMLAFHGRDMSFAAEPGEFRIWIGPDSASGSEGKFRLE